MAKASKEIWLTTSEAAELEGISDRAVRKKAAGGTWLTKIDQSPSRGGNAGKRYLVALSSLTTLAQKRWLEKQQQSPVSAPLACTIETETKPIKETVQPIRPVNLAEIKALVGERKFSEMMQEADQKAAAVKEFLDLEDGSGKSCKAREIAARFDVSASTLYRWVEDYQTGGTTALMRKLPSLGIGIARRVVPEEIELLAQAEYLQLNKPKVAHVYRKVVKYCELNGIKAPSRATIYRVIEELEETQPDLVCLAREGEEE